MININELERLAAVERSSWKPKRIRCCVAAGCRSAGADDVVHALQNAIETCDLTATTEVVPVGCMRLCCEGPLLQTSSNGPFIARVQPTDAPAIVEGLTDSPPDSLRTIPSMHPFFAGQTPIVLEHCGQIDPTRIESSIAHGAYQTLAQVLHDLQPLEIVDVITRSGLRGRGGAGYPTGLKWATVAKARSTTKYVICNADEGDPGAFKDRTVLESDPHRVLEGMAIAAYAVGATRGFIYIRGEYRLAIERLETALKQARKAGILGSRIFDTAFDFSVEIRVGAGAFVCGEETALMASIEGQRGTPHPRPPYPAERGLWDAPTLINNVETLATVTPILRNGPEWYASIGTQRSKGTKVFSLSGQVQNTGLIEIAMGTPLRTIVEGMAGGARDGQRIKAIQTGGPSGGCIPAELLDTPVEYESLAALGSIMGSGGMVVLDDSTDMVKVAQFFMDFCREESCGKCIPCRAGTVQMHRLLSKIHDRKASRLELEQLEELAEVVKVTSLCGLGQSAPNPVLSTLRHFRHEYEQKLSDPTQGDDACVSAHS